MDTTTIDIRDVDYELEVTRPVWLPYNDISKSITTSLMADLGYPTHGPKASKYEVVLASLLKSAQSHLQSVNNRRPHYIGVQRRASAWSQYPMVGRTISHKVIEDFLALYRGQKVEGSGTSGLHKDERGKWATDPKMSMYTLDLAKLPKQLLLARFVEAGRPLAKVNEAETKPQRDKRRASKLSKPFLSNQHSRMIGQEAYTAAQSRIQRLNGYYLEHPLELPNGHAAASVTRVFHDGRLDAGGRLYGAWTGLDQKEQRLHCTIDGEPIVEIDIRASQPTLLSSLLGYKLGALGPDETWHDVYGQLSGLVNVDHIWTIWDDKIDKLELIKRNRNVAKAVVMALIGSGTPLKPKATPDVVEQFGLTANGWSRFRDQLLKTVPALLELEPRYDKNGQLSGYINGAGYLSYHESEMTLRTLEVLVDQNIPAYSVHDSLLVKVSDATVAAQTFRQIIHDYCERLSGLKVLVPLSLTIQADMSGIQLPSDNELMGRYLV